MTDALVVHLNRSEHHAIEPASDSFETDGPFVVHIENHGEGSHLHCSLSGDLASTATVSEGNPFLEPDEAMEIPVDVGTDLRPARGTLELSTGYGRESVAIGVLVRESTNVPTSPIEHDAAGADGEPDGAASTSPTTAGAAAGAANVADQSADGGAANVVERTVTKIETSASDAIDSLTPRLDTATGLLAGLSVLAILIALGAWLFLDGAVVRLAVFVVLATVIGAAGALVRR